VALARELPAAARRAAGARFLWFTLLATVFDGAELTLLSFFFPHLARDFRVGLQPLVAVNTLQGLAALAGGLLFGPLADRHGRRLALAATVGLYGGATVAGALTHNFPAFVATRLMAGLGIGGEFGVAFALFNEWWAGRGRGLAGAMVQNMFVVGIVLTTVTGWATSGLPGGMSWRVAYACLGAASLAVFLAVLLGMPESETWQAYARARRSGSLPAALQVHGSPLALLAGPWRAATLWGLGVATGVFYLSYSLLLFAPTLLVRTWHLSPRAESAFLLTGDAALFVGSLVAGLLGDTWGRRQAAAALAGVALVGYGLYALSWQGRPGGHLVSWPLWWAALAINFGNGAIAVLGVWLGELYPTRLRATGENLVYYVGRGLGASVLPLVALALVQGVVGWALGCGGLGAALALACSLGAPEARGREIRALE
jgi:MFS family permease